MAKYLGIPLTISNGNRIPLTAQPELVDTTVTQSSDWFASATAPSTASITSDGGLVNVVSGNFAYVRTNVNSLFTIGKSYTATIRLQRTSGSGGGVGVRQTVGSPIITKNLTGEIQEITYNFTAYVDDQLYILREGTGDYSFLVSYVSIKEIAATETPTYGSPQLVENSEFNEGNVDWTFLGTNPPSINTTTDTLDFTNSPSTAVAKTTDTILEQGKRYIATIDIESITSGALALVYSAGTYSPNFTSAGVYNYEFVQDGTLSLASIECYSRNASTTAVVNSIKVKEVPYVVGTREFVKNGDFATDSDWVTENTSGWVISGNGKAERNGATTNTDFRQNIPVEAGKTYKFSYTREYISGGGQTNLYLKLDGINPTSAIGNVTSTTVGELIVTGTFSVSFTGDLNFRVFGINDFTGSINNVSVEELEYNYLQVSDGGFTKSVKKGDVVFNTSTSTEGVVKEVVDNNVLLMSNDNFSTAGEFFNVFAANGDTRGNQLIKTDNYIMSQYDENTSNPQESSFWFAGGKNSDKVALTQLNPATNTFFVAGVIEEYLERLNSQSATDSRLDIPLDEFRDHQYNEILTTTAITLS